MPHPRRRAPENDVSYVDPGGGAGAGDSAKDTLLDTRRLAENAGFIAKPFTAESLTRKVGELLGR